MWEGRVFHLLSIQVLRTHFEWMGVLCWGWLMYNSYVDRTLLYDGSKQTPYNIKGFLAYINIGELGNYWLTLWLVGHSGPQYDMIDELKGTSDSNEGHRIMKIFMITSSNGNIFRVTGICACNSSVTGDFPPQRPVMFSLICAWTNIWVNNGGAGDLRRHCAH